MLRSPAFRIATWVALLCLSAAAMPIGARADTNAGSTEYHFSTTLRTVYGSQYPLAGHLDLQVFPNGSLRGFYHNAFQKAFVQVVGGRDGNYIWFDIGPSPVDLGLGLGNGERLHIVANMDAGGAFRGQAYPQYNTEVDTFPPPGPITGYQSTDYEQYIFAAQPVEKSAEDYQAPQPLGSPAASNPPPSTTKSTYAQ
jgi:hypothetical protein